MNKKKSRTVLKCTDLYDKALSRYQNLLTVREEMEKELEGASPGKIRVAKTENRIQFYLRRESAEKAGIYIPKGESGKLKHYLQKAYDEKALIFVDREIHILGKFIKNSDGISDRIRQLYSDNPDEVKKYIDPIDEADEDRVKRWESTLYESKKLSDYTTVYETKRGEKVRSKSELNIANTLAEKGIPYKYECPLKLKNGVIVYPDFTVLNVRERRQIYWEHRGMMDDKEYAKNSVLKMKTYMKNGLFIGRDLIISEETSANPLGTDEINAIVKVFFGE